MLACDSHDCQGAVPFGVYGETGNMGFEEGRVYSDGAEVEGEWGEKQFAVCAAEVMGQLAFWWTILWVRVGYVGKESGEVLCVPRK